MAKQTQVLNRFDGGINDQFSQQDIPDNTLVRADNVMVDKPGRIRLVGSQQDHGLGDVPGTTTPGYGMFVFQSDFDNVLPSVEKSPNSTAGLISGFSADDDGGVLDVDTSGSNNVKIYDTTNTDAAGRWILQKGNGTNSDNDDGWYYDTSNRFIIGDTSGGAGIKYAFTTQTEPGKCYKISYQVYIIANTTTVKAWCHGGINLSTGLYVGSSQTTHGYYTEYFEVKSNANGKIGIQMLNSSADGGAIISYVSIMEVPSIRDTSYIAFQNENATYLRDTTNNIWRKEALGQQYESDGTTVVSTHGVINMDVDNSPTTSHKSTDSQPIFYIADGILRICDTNFTNANTISKWYGILNRTFFEDTSGTAVWRTWYAGDQKLYKPHSTSHISSFTDATCNKTIRDATVACTSSANIEVGQYVSGPGIFPDTVVATVNVVGAVTSFELSKAAFDGDTSTLTFATKKNYYPGRIITTQEDSSGTSTYPDLNSDGYAVDGLKFNIGLDKDTAGAETAENGSWESSSYKFYVSYLYDKAKQESGLTYVNTITTGAANSALATAVSVRWYDDIKKVYLFNERVTGARFYYSDSEDADGLYYQLLEVDFEKGVRKYDELEFTSWSNQSSLNLQSILTTAQTTALADSLNGNNTKFDFATSTTSLITSNGFVETADCTFVNSSGVGKLTNDSATAGRATLAFTTIVGVTYDVKFDITEIDTANVKVSLSTSDASNDSNKVTTAGEAIGYQLDTPYVANDTSTFLVLELTSSLDTKFVKIDNLEIFANAVVQCPAASLTTATTLATSFHFLHPPKVLTYQALNGYDSDEETIFKYKTAVIANRRCYIGNVARLDTTNYANNIIEKFNDRIIKSPVNKFDTFPEGNFLDVTVNDGDEIIRLETFADRLMQFKKKKMFIINISQDVEFLESEHNFMGVDHHAAVTKTEIGIIWTNPRGCYVYDGKQIKNLIDNKINVNTWKAFLNISGMVGYIPDKKQIMVVKDPGQSDGNCYIYDFTTTSWTYGNNLLSYVMKTNMANDKFGNLIWGEYTNESSSSIYAGLTDPGFSGNAQTGSIGITPVATLTFECPSQFANIEEGGATES